MTPDHVDVLIVGAGISGVGAAHHLQQNCPGKTYAILEAREDLGGTWDLFRYPGIRSDSDMHTLGFNFKPWTAPKSIADGDTILDYVRETADENGIEPRIRYGHRVVSAEWSTPDSLWTVARRAPRHGGDGGAHLRLPLHVQRLLPLRPGLHSRVRRASPTSSGEVIHPQHWPEDLDYAGKRVVVIGSGATAVTLVPAMAETAAKVTMLQRSPTYVISMPAKTRIANFLHRFLPEKRRLRDRALEERAPAVDLLPAQPQAAGADQADPAQERRPGRCRPATTSTKHFNPKYNPWDQRVCLVPDGDLFDVALLRPGGDRHRPDRALHRERPRASSPARELEADVIVTATGLNLLFLGDVEFSVDGEAPDIPGSFTYKGMMLNDVPNLAFALGYTNASWTLKVDLTCEYVCRLLNHMDEHGYTQCVPRVTDPSVTEEQLIDFNSGYVLRSLHELPKQGSKVPWKLRQNYVRDVPELRFGEVADGAMHFSAPASQPAPAEPAAV